MKTRQEERVRAFVRKAYGRLARGEAAGCGCGEPDTATQPEGADLVLGCGRPGTRAAYRPGETILDLGAGAGADCFAAAREVGPEGRVIGVDMTPDMIARARKSAADAGIENVEFRLGEIESLPVADASVDAIISNCVVNLSPAKERVYREAFRVLRPGGRLAIADIVAYGPLPEQVSEDLMSIAACVGGAQEIEGIEEMLAAVGFADIRVDVLPESREVLASWFPGRGFEDHVASAYITATRPDS